MKEIVIKANEEGMKAIEQMVDITLKTGGIQNLTAVNQILSKCELLEEEKEEK